MTVHFSLAHPKAFPPMPQDIVHEGAKMIFEKENVSHQ